MRSKVGAESARRREARIASMSPADRVELARRLGETGLAAFIAVHGVDEPTARARIRATRRAGRPRSASAEWP
jgi:hypothetical protein